MASTIELKARTSGWQLVITFVINSQVRALSFNESNDERFPLSCLILSRSYAKGPFYATKNELEDRKGQDRKFLIQLVAE